MCKALNCVVKRFSYWKFIRDTNEQTSEENWIYALRNKGNSPRGTSELLVTQNPTRRRYQPSPKTSFLLPIMEVAMPENNENNMVVSVQGNNDGSMVLEMENNEGSMVVQVPDEDLTALPPIRKPKEPGKWKGYDAKRVFKKEWEVVYPWLSGDPDDPTHALCKVCGKKIRAHKGDIEKHQKTKRHLKKQTTSDILADLIPISCENLDGTKNSSEIDHNDARVVTNSGPVSNDVSDGQQIIYFTESAVDTQQNTNALIDKLVEKYHQKRIENLKVEHEATLDLNKEQLGILKQQLEADAQLNENKTQLAKEEHDIRLKFLQREHEAKLKAIEDERDARLRAIEQELLFARQEYEKKMRLLDVQLSSMK